MNTGRHRAYPMHRYRSKAGKGPVKCPSLADFPVKTGSGTEPQAIREFARYVIRNGHGLAPRAFRTPSGSAGRRIGRF